MTNDTKPHRNYLLDNYKALLIILVVVGHFIEVGVDDSTFLFSLKWLIFSFHMPAFIFISGYFSKKSYPLKKLVHSLLIPYLVFEVLYYILYTWIIHVDTQLYLLYPKFSLWYLMALFVWKLITPYVKKVPGHIFLAIIAGLAVGASSLDDNFLTLPRMITFYPFFLIGVSFKEEWLEKIRTKKYTIIAIVSVVLLNAVMLWVGLHSGLSPKIFYGRYNYDYLELSLFLGVSLRMIFYIIAGVMTLCLLVLMPNEQNRFTSLGAHTMPIYLFHGLVYSCFKQGAKYYSMTGSLGQIAICLITSLIVVWLLSRKPFVAFTKMISQDFFTKKG